MGRRGVADPKGEEPSRWGGGLHFLAELQICSLWGTLVGRTIQAPRDPRSIG